MIWFANFILSSFLMQQIILGDAGSVSYSKSLEDDSQGNVKRVKREFIFSKENVSINGVELTVSRKEDHNGSHNEHSEGKQSGANAEKHKEEHERTHEVKDESRQREEPEEEHGVKDEEDNVEEHEEKLNETEHAQKLEGGLIKEQRAEVDLGKSKSNTNCSLQPCIENSVCMLMNHCGCAPGYTESTSVNDNGIMLHFCLAIVEQTTVENTNDSGNSIELYNPDEQCKLMYNTIGGFIIVVALLGVIVLSVKKPPRNSKYSFSSNWR